MAFSAPSAASSPPASKTASAENPQLTLHAGALLEPVQHGHGDDAAPPSALAAKMASSAAASRTTTPTRACQNERPLLRSPMKPNPYDFRQFQQELAALDRKTAAAEPMEPAKPAKPASKKEAAQARLLQARSEFLALRERYGLTVADVVTFFPEEEGITYLQGLIAEQDAKPRRRAKSTK